jgi:hypothetical protein
MITEADMKLVELQAYNRYLQDMKDRAIFEKRQSVDEFKNLKDEERYEYQGAIQVASARKHIRNSLFDQMKYRHEKEKFERDIDRGVPHI